MLSPFLQPPPPSIHLLNFEPNLSHCSMLTLFLFIWICSLNFYMIIFKITGCGTVINLKENRQLTFMPHHSYHVRKNLRNCKDIECFVSPKNCSSIPLLHLCSSVKTFFQRTSSATTNTGSAPAANTKYISSPNSCYTHATLLHIFFPCLPVFYADTWFLLSRDQGQKIPKKADEGKCPTSCDFFAMGLTIMGCKRSQASTKTLHWQFRSWFGAEPL